MGQALYRKYRSKSLDEIVGQEHVTKTLKEAIDKDRISHAYLFTGPRGVGKTSIARILAHEINELPYKDDSSHIDIIEIDAASNRRIDEIREIRDKVYVAPTSAKYKVYIIDEVHMLTKEAFNALLKTLEEPPAHVVFILATTDAHKLPETIISRTQRFSFKPGDKAEVTDHLAEIAQKEGIKASMEALQLIAEHGEGSFRDSVSLLDQASNRDETLEVETVQKLLGIPPTDALRALIDIIASGQPSHSAMRQLAELYGQGYQASTIAKQLSHLIRQAVINNENQLDGDTTLRLLAKLVEVPASHDPERFLEISLLQSLKPAPVSSQDTGSIKSSSHKQSLKVPTQPSISDKHQPKAIQEPEPVPAKEPIKPGSAVFDPDIWPEVLTALKQKHNTLYGVVRMAQPDFSDEGALKLIFAFPFHEKRIKESSNRQKLADIIFELTGQSVSIECLLDKSATKSKSSEAPKSELTAISNIFGGGELLES